MFDRIASAFATFDTARLVKPFAAAEVSLSLNGMTITLTTQVDVGRYRQVAL